MIEVLAIMAISSLANAASLPAKSDGDDNLDLSGMFGMFKGAALDRPEGLLDGSHDLMGMMDRQKFMMQQSARAIQLAGGHKRCSGEVGCCTGQCGFSEGGCDSNSDCLGQSICGGEDSCDQIEAIAKIQFADWEAAMGWAEARRLALLLGNGTAVAGGPAKRCCVLPVRLEPTELSVDLAPMALKMATKMLTGDDGQRMLRLIYEKIMKQPPTTREIQQDPMRAVLG